MFNGKILSAFNTWVVAVFATHLPIQHSLALTMPCNFDAVTASAQSMLSFDQSFKMQICNVLDIPLKTITLLCRSHQRGSVTVEVVLSDVEEESDSQVRSARNLARHLARVCIDEASTFASCGLQICAMKAQVHGPVSQALLESVQTSWAQQHQLQYLSQQAEILDLMSRQAQVIRCREDWKMVTCLLHIWHSNTRLCVNIKLFDEKQNEATMRGHLGRWHGHTAQYHRFMRLGAKVMKKCTRSRNLDVLSKWKHNVDGKIQMRYMCRQIVQRWTTLLLHQCWVQWVQAFETQMRMQKGVAKVVRCWLHLNLFAAYDKWIVYLRHLAGKRIRNSRRKRFYERKQMNRMTREFESWHIHVKVEFKFRAAHRARDSFAMAHFVLAIETQRVNGQRNANALNYARICLQHRVFSEWGGWFHDHKNYRLKSRLGYTRVSAKFVMHSKKLGLKIWKQHISEYYYPILRQFERLSRRRLTKTAADRMPDLLQNEMDKALARIISGQASTDSASVNLRQDFLKGAFDCWTHRTPQFHGSSVFGAGALKFMMNP